MDDKNVVAARIGLPFKCEVCSKIHEKADLNNKSVCRCFAKVWKSVLGSSPKWFSKSGDKLIGRPTWELEETEYFNIPKIRHSYPIENDVFMLSIPMEKTVESLRKKFEDWKTDCLTNAIKLIEENGELNEVTIKGGALFINGIGRIYGTVLAPLIMKNREVIPALKWIWEGNILDVEWKSLKESAKVLAMVWSSGEEFTMFASEKTGVIQVPNEIDSIRKAENYLLSGGQPCGKVTATEFPI